MRKRAIRVMWAEDNIGDILLIKEAFELAGISHRLMEVNDGAEAIDYLLRRGRYSRAQRPELIILDLNLPKKSGREVIAEIKAAGLQDIPLVVLTSSAGDRDVLEGLNPQRCLYLVKPMSFAELVELGKQIQEFLMSIR